jgi:hypothetical protein
MTIDVPSIIVQWQAPLWAETHVIDEQAVIHSRSVGTFKRHPLDDECEVRLVQRDEFDEVGDVGSITRQPAYFVVDGDMVTVSEAPALARLLLAGAAIIQDGGACRPPARGHLDLPHRVFIPVRRWGAATLAFLPILVRRRR